MKPCKKAAQPELAVQHLLPQIRTGWSWSENKLMTDSPLAMRCIVSAISGATKANIWSKPSILAVFVSRTCLKSSLKSSLKSLQKPSFQP